MNYKDINAYYIFYYCANLKSFSKVSRELGVTQPTITYIINKLEENLNLKLFNRQTNGIELTKEGKVFYLYVKKSIETLNLGLKVIDEVKNIKNYKIIIGTTSSIGAHFITKIILKFNKEFPNVKVKIIENDIETLKENLKNGKIDILIDLENIKENELSDNIKRTKIKTLRAGFWASRKFDYLSDKIISKEELVLLPILLPTEETRARRYIETISKGKGINLIPIIETNSIEIASKIIYEGIGLSWIIYDFIEKDINNGFLIKIKTPIPEKTIDLYINYRKENKNKALKKMIKLLEE